jgi:hypothetical protein
MLCYHLNDSFAKYRILIFINLKLHQVKNSNLTDEVSEACMRVDKTEIFTYRKKLEIRSLKLVQ